MKWNRFVKIVREVTRVFASKDLQWERIANAKTSTSAPGTPVRSAHPIRNASTQSAPTGANVKKDFVRDQILALASVNCIVDCPIGTIDLIIIIINTRFLGFINDKISTSVLRRLVCASKRVLTPGARISVAARPATNWQRTVGRVKTWTNANCTRNEVDFALVSASTNPVHTVASVLMATDWLPTTGRVKVCFLVPQQFHFLCIDLKAIFYVSVRHRRMRQTGRLP